MIEQIQPQEYRVLYTDGDNIVDNGKPTTTLAQLQADFPLPNWAFLLPNDVPENWQDMTIVDGALVLATAEVIETRRVTRLATDTEAANSNRKADYTLLTDPAWLEIQEDWARSQPDNPKCVAWIAKKDAIRLAHPKPTTTQQEAE